MAVHYHAIAARCTSSHRNTAKVSSGTMRHTIPLLFTMLFTVHVSASPDGLAKDGQDAIKDATQTLESEIGHFIWRHGVPGAAVAVAVDGKIVYEQGFGWADVDKAIPVTPASRFRIASITKPFTAVAILQLVEQGKLSLDDNPFDVIGMAEQIRTPEADPRLRDITIEQCLSHTAGFGHRSPGPDPMFQEDRLTETLELKSRPQNTDLVRYVISQTLTRTPGSFHDYSNAGYTILGLVLEHITGTSYESVIHKQLADPLHLADIDMGGPLPSDRLPGEVVYYNRLRKTQDIRTSDGSTENVPFGYSHPPMAFGGAGGLVTSAGSLVKFAGDLHRQSESTLLSEKSIRQMWTPTLTNRKYNLAHYSRGEGYGLGWWAGLRPDGRIDAEHTGGISGSCSSQLTKYYDGCAVAVLFNASDSAITGQYLHNAFHSELGSHAHHLGQLHLESTAMLNE
jgi:N-acyl-D-amino-acid deacylase